MNERFLAGRYRLQDAIGGRSDLFHAEDVSLKRQVAVKRLGSGLTGAYRQQWEQEIAQAASLHDPHLLSIYDVVLEDDSLYLITEDLEGTPLARWVREHAPLTPEATVGMIRQLAGAVVQVEKHGLEAIAIDPHSVLVTREGFLKVFNYGPLYAAERGSLHVDAHRQRLETLGILLYEMLTGRTYSDLLKGEHVLEDVRTALRGAKVEHDWLPDRLLAILARSFGLSETASMYVSVQELHKEIKALHHAMGQAVVQNAAQQAAGELVRTKEEPSKVSRATEQVISMAQERLSKMTQLRTEQSKSERRGRAPLTYLWGALVIVLVAGALWWTLGDTTMTANGDEVRREAGQQITMPSLLHKTEQQAFQILMEKGFPAEHISVVYKPTEEKVGKGIVYSQSADPNAPVLTTQVVTLTINGQVDPGANGGVQAEPSAVQTAEGQVPDLSGLSRQEAEQQLLRLGYRYSFQIEPGNTAAGTVFRQEPAAGTAAAKGVRIIFSVSR